MQLFFSPTSPYARKVRVVLIEKGVPFTGIDVTASGRSAAEHNPLGKVPTLVLDDGEVLFDSRVICEALESLYALPPLVPPGGAERRAVRRWEALADGICDVLIPIVLDSRRPPELRDAAQTRKLESKVRAAFDYVEVVVRGREHLGQQFSLADIALTCALGYVRLRRPELLAGRSVLEDYLARQQRRPSLASTIPPNAPVRG